MEVTKTPLLFSGFESVALVAVAMLVKKVPGGVAGAMWKTNVKSAVARAARLGIVHVMRPPEPTAGVVQPGGEAETKVIPGGMGSLSAMLPEASGPPLNTETVYVTLLPAAAWTGPDLETEMSASWAQARDAPRRFARTAMRTSRRSA